MPPRRDDTDPVRRHVAPSGYSGRFMRPVPVTPRFAVSAVPAVPALACASAAIPVRRFEYHHYLPLEGYVREAREEFDELWEAVEDNFLRFEPIWDPMKYIVKPMLEPRLFTRTATTDIYEFLGKFYFKSMISRDAYHKIVDGNLTSEFLGGLASLAADPWSLDGVWEVIHIEDGWVLANRLYGR